MAVSFAVTRREWVDVGGGDRADVPLVLVAFVARGNGAVAGEAEFFCKNFLLTLTVLNRLGSGADKLVGVGLEAVEGLGTELRNSSDLADISKSAGGIAFSWMVVGSACGAGAVKPVLRIESSVVDWG